MARPREFDEDTALDAAIQCFWAQGFEATSMRNLIETTGLAGASLYNAFGDKQALYRRALDRYVEERVAERIRRCEALAPRQAIGAYFAGILELSLADPEHKGCMLINAALAVEPDDLELRDSVARALTRVEAFFRAQVEAGQADGTIARSVPAETLAQHLLGALIGVRVLARVRPERALLEGVVAGALALLDRADDHERAR